jgi:hypothetical protein
MCQCKENGEDGKLKLVVLFSERAIKTGLNWYKKTHLAPIDLKIGVWKK